MNPEELIGAQVALRAPDGKTLLFRIASLVPLENETYAVLEEDRENGMLLVTHVEEENGEPAFVVEGEEEIISAVLEKQVARVIARAMESDAGDGNVFGGADKRGADKYDADERGGADERACACGHDHGHPHDCSCGHGH